MAIGRKTGGGSRKGIPNKRQAMHFGDIAARVTERVDLAGVFVELLRDPKLRIDALKIFCEYAFSKPKQQVEHSAVEFGLGSIPAEALGLNGTNGRVN